MPETDESNRNAHDAGGDVRAVRDLFESALGLDEHAREHLLRAGDAAETVVAEVRRLLDRLDAAEQADPAEPGWKNDPRLGRVVVGHERRWRLVRVIGEGGSGRVYEGLDEGGGPSVAIKIIDHARATGERLARLHDEHRALRAVDHPGVIRPIDARLDSDANDDPWIATELVVGGRPVTEFVLDLPDGPARVATILDLVADLAEAVAAAHRVGIVHRDLKPSNVLVDRDGRLRVIDFGIARLQGLGRDGPTLSIDRTREGDLVGTPAYMTPEQVDATLGPIGPATDVHAIGVLAHRLLTDRLPYAIGDTLLSAAQAIRFVPPRPLHQFATDETALPAAVADLLTQCLAKSPTERPGDAEAFRDALAHARAGTRRPRTESFQHRRRGTRAAAASFIVLAGAAAITITALRPDPGAVPGRTEDRPPSGPDMPATTSAGDGVEEMRLNAADLISVLAIGLCASSVQADDCNGDGIQDACQISSGYLTDADGNGIPDCCDAGEPCGATYSSEILLSEPMLYHRLGGDSLTSENLGWLGPAGDGIFGGNVVRNINGGITDDDGAVRFEQGSISIAPNTEFNAGAAPQMTVEFWIRPEFSQLVYGYPVSNGFDYRNGFWGVVVRKFNGSTLASPGFTFRNNCDGFDWNPSGAAANEWFHLAVRHDFVSMTYEIFMNGESYFESTSNHCPGNNGASLHLGRHGLPSFPYWFIGDMDEFALYDHALSNDEIRRRAIRGSMGFVDLDKNGVDDLFQSMTCDSDLPCPGNLTKDDMVNAADLGILLAVWGDASQFPAADVNQDGNVDAADLGLMLGNWGPCPGG